MRERPDYAYRTADRALRDFWAAKQSANGDVPLAAAPVPNEPPVSERKVRSFPQPIRGDDLLSRDIPIPQMLVDDVLPEDACGYLAGEPKTLKTYTLLELAICLSSGQPVFGHFEVNRTGPVLLFLEETKVSEAKRRLDLLRVGHELPLSAVSDILIHPQRGFRLDEPGYQEEIRRQLEQYQPIVSVFDPLSRMRSGSENQPEHLLPVLDFLRRVQVDFNSAVLLTHHLTKPSKEEDSNRRLGHRIRGTGDQYAWLDVFWGFTRRKDGDRIQIDVELRDAAMLEPFTIGLSMEKKNGVEAARLTYSAGKLSSEGVQNAAEEILQLLSSEPDGMKTKDIYSRAEARKDDVNEAFKVLEQQEKIVSRMEKRPDASGVQRSCKIRYVAPMAPEGVD